MDSITATNVHGTFTVSSAVVNRMMDKAISAPITSLRAALAEARGTSATEYRDLLRIDMIVMLASVLEAKKPSPSERRGQAIKAIVDSCFDHSAVPMRFTKTPDDRQHLATEILELDRLGKAVRWKAAVRNWAALVEKPNEDASYLRWAIIQGGINAGHAAD